MMLMRPSFVSQAPGSVQMSLGGGAQWTHPHPHHPQFHGMGHERPIFEMPSYKKRRYKQRERKTVPFLQKLISLFQDHPDLIKFDNGTIVIPNPKRLELVLPAYFRHGKYTSFQRQLNNFGYTKFDKSAGPLQSIYVKAKGPPVSCFQDLLTLRHSFRRVPADDDDDDKYNLPMHHGYSVVRTTPRTSAPPPPHNQMQGSVLGGGGGGGGACGGSIYAAPRPAQLPSHVIYDPVSGVAEQWPSVVATLPPSHHLHHQQQQQQQQQQPPPPKKKKTKKEGSSLEAVDNLLNLRHARLGGQSSSSASSSADEKEYGPTFPTMLDNAKTSVSAAPERRPPLPQRFALPTAVDNQRPPPSWGRCDFVAPEQQQLGYDPTAGSVIDRANVTIDMLRSRLAASEKDRLAAWDDAFRMRDQLADIAMQKSEPRLPTDVGPSTAGYHSFSRYIVPTH